MLETQDPKQEWHFQMDWHQNQWKKADMIFDFIDNQSTVLFPFATCIPAVPCNQHIQQKCMLIDDK